MSNAPRILIATEVVADADIVRSLLSDEFEAIGLSTDMEHAPDIFDAYLPDVLVLAFNTLEKAQHYSLGLYRLGKQARLHAYATIVLARREELTSVYDLCRKAYFDDYVLFWPPTHDVKRLPMAVHLAARCLRARNGEGGVPIAEFSGQARELATLGPTVAALAEDGMVQMQSAERTLGDANRELGLALDTFAHKVTSGELRSVIEVIDQGGLQRELVTFRQEQLERQGAASDNAIATLREWVQELNTKLAPTVARTLALQEMARKHPPLLFMVDDDEFQHKLMAQIVRDWPLRLQFASSGEQAFAMLRAQRPDLMLLDIDLPDMNGIDGMRMVHAVERLVEMPIVIISGHAEKRVVVDSFAAGAAGYILKPFDKQAVRERIGQLLFIEETGER